MAMLVLVKFDNDEDAINFVEAVEDGNVHAADGSNMFDEKVEAPAMYKFPTMFHKAFETHGAGKTGSAWTLGQKWGWWVCSICKKPSELYFSQIAKQSSFGKNIKSMFFEEETSN